MTGMDAALQGLAHACGRAWEVWTLAPDWLRYGALALIAVYVLWLVLFFTQRRIHSPTRRAYTLQTAGWSVHARPSWKRRTDRHW
ncbi:MAG: hypothetical protein JKP95_03205 [Oceanicaulis sp.]|nr:hypothetical protein [Oceanicaulis sp.]